MNKKNKIPSNQELVDSAISSTIKDLTTLKRNPSLGRNKRTRQNAGIKLFGSKSPLCLTVEIDHEDSKRNGKLCELKNPHLNCPYASGKFGCRKLHTYIYEENRSESTRIEMQLRTWKRIKKEFQRLDPSDFHKNETARTKLRDIVKEINGNVYIEFEVNGLI